MSLAKMTLIGFYNAYEDYDPIFENLTLPDGIDKDLFINSLLLDAGEFEVLYADPDFYKNAISIWGRKWYRTFQKWYEALQVNYDPLSNYDRHEEWSTDSSFTGSARDSSTSSGTTSGTTSETTSGTSSNTTNRSAYDSSALTPYESESGTTSGNSSGTSSGTSSDTTTGESSSNNSTNEIRSGRAYGNIGVTTSQQMLEAELSLQEWNLYQHMIDLFKTELLIPIY